MNNMIFGKLRNKKNNDVEIEEVTDSSMFSSFKKDKKEVKEVKETKTELIKKDESLSGLKLPDNYVAMPHYFSQSAIYAPRSGNRKEISKRTDLWSQGDNHVSYEGPSLDTKIDIQLMSLVLKARDIQKAPNNIVKLKFKETMKVLGLNPHHPNSRTKFLNSINRHLEAKLYFSIGNEEEGFWKSFFVAEGTTYSYKQNILKIQIGEIIPTLFKLKDSGSFSIENMLISFAAKSSYSSKLYSYYESNETPFPIKVSTILEICDKKIEDGKKPTNNHRKVIKEALDELVSLSFLESWHYDSSKDKRDPLVVVKKKPKKDRSLEVKKIDFKTDYMIGEKRDGF